jgi:hypothetical protein
MEKEYYTKRVTRCNIEINVTCQRKWYVWLLVESTISLHLVATQWYKTIYEGWRWIVQATLNYTFNRSASESSTHIIYCKLNKRSYGTCQPWFPSMLDQRGHFLLNEGRDRPSQKKFGKTIANNDEPGDTCRRLGCWPIPWFVRHWLWNRYHKRTI